MPIRALFEDAYGCKFEQVYKERRSFLSSVRRGKNATFINAVDVERQFIVYPSNLPEYKAAL